MKNLLAGLFTIMASVVYSQSPVVPYGTVLQDEIQMKECSFDKDAEAVILHDYAVAMHNDEYNLITTRRVKFKILKESGIDRGSVVIPYYSYDDNEFIRSVKGYVHNRDENGVPYQKNLEKSGIFRQQVNARYSELRLAMPDIKVGSIVEYEYESVMKHWGFLDEWNFQEDIPTVLSHYDITILPNAEFAYSIVKKSDMPISIKPIQDQGRVLFEMKNVGALRSEPYMDGYKEYRQRVVFQLSQFKTRSGVVTKYNNTWSQLAKEMASHESVGRPTEKNISGAAELLATVKVLATEKEKMEAIFSFVRRSFNWNGNYSITASDGLKSVWEKRSGNNGELNLLLVNLLKEAKLEAYPLLVSERRHGSINLEYPFIDYFNKVIAYVVADKKDYVLDASDSYTPANMIPFDFINTHGFIVNKKSTAPVKLSDNKIIKSFTGVKSTLDESGIITGQASVTSYDYDKINRLKTFKAGGTKALADKYYLKEETDLSVDSIKVKGFDVDSLPLEELYQFKVSSTSSGDYKLINLNLFSDFTRSPFVAENRFTNINFGTNYLKAITQVIELPAGMKPDELPKNINLVMPDKSISFYRTIDYDEKSNIVNVRLNLQIQRPVFEPHEYRSVKDFFKKMVDFLNEPLVVKKK